MNKIVKVAAAQIAPVNMDRDRIVEKVCQVILEAGGNGAQLVVFPETIIPGYLVVNRKKQSPLIFKENEND